MKRGARGFEHSLITSTRCQSHNVVPDRSDILNSVREVAQRFLFESSGADSFSIQAHRQWQCTPCARFLRRLDRLDP